MIRQPTPPAVAYAWHANALRGVYGDEIVTTEEPQPGWFKRRLVKGGVFVPARIWIDGETDPDTGELLSDERLRCEVNGRSADPHEEWQWLAGAPISEAEFRYLTAVAAHAGWHQPDQPQANPRRPIDWMTVRPPHFSTGAKHT